MKIRTGSFQIYFTLKRIYNTKTYKMPQQSARQQLLKEIDSIIFLAILFDEEDDEIEELMDIKFAISSSRFIGPRTSIPKTVELRNLLWELPDTEFKQVCLFWKKVARMNRNSFLFLLTEISDHQIFQNTSLNPQRDVWIQTIVALERMGCDGNGASVGRIARAMGVGNGTVTLYTHRVVTALLSLTT